MLAYLSHWIVQVFIAIFCTLLIAFIQKVVMNHIHKKLLKTNNFWDNIFVDSLTFPLHIFIWLMGILIAAQIAGAQTDVAIFSLINPIRVLGIITLISWFLTRFVKRAESNIVASYERVDKTTADAIGKILRASIMITAALVVLQTLGVSLSGILAFGGIGGIAIGFAAKDLLANFFGAFMLYLDRPFSVGDWIRSPDREIEGTVEQIGWRLTRIRTFDKRPIYVPNSLFTTITIENPSRMQNRRIYETIGVRYGDVTQVPLILEGIRNMLKTHPEIDTKQILMVNLNQFGPSSLDFFIYTFTKTTEWAFFHEIKEDVLLKIHKIIQSHGAEVAFPTTTIHLAENEEPNPELLSTRVSAAQTPLRP